MWQALGIVLGAMIIAWSIHEGMSILGSALYQAICDAPRCEESEAEGMN